jgi:hypothetical protein
LGEREIRELKSGTQRKHPVDTHHHPGDLGHRDRRTGSVRQEHYRRAAR